MIRSCSAAALLLVPTVATAQTEPEVVVTGRGLPDRPGDAASAITTIDRARIAESASGRLESVLADVAGLQQFRRSDARSANPTSQGITLRGIGGNASSRALLILDGVPQADPFGGWVAFPAYATRRIGRVRVTRGGGSGYYGSGALAGTVELESATPSQLAPIDASAAYGSRGSVDAQAGLALIRGAGFATLSGALSRGDGFIPTIEDDRGPADRPAPYRQASAAARGVVSIDAGTELQVALNGFSDRRERGTAFTANSSEGADASVRLIGRGRWGWSALAYLQTRDFASSFAAIDAARTTATQTLNQYSTPATGIGGRLEVAPRLGEQGTLRLGADLRSLEGTTQELFTFVGGLPTRRRQAGGATRTIGAFADGSLESGPWTMTLGGRIDAWRIAGGFLSERNRVGNPPITDARFPERRGTQATGRAGLAWRADPSLTLRAAAYRGWRLPTLNELYRPFRVGADATAANAALSPERLSGAEAGVTATPLPGVTIAATTFWSRLDDAIANVTVGQGPGAFPGVGFVAAGGAFRARRNLDQVDTSGLEIDASWASGPIEARLSWSHVDPTIIASGEAASLDGLRPAQTPRDTISATIGWRRDRASAALTVRHAGRQFEDDQNSRALSSATTVDAFATLPLGPALKVEARAENLFDARVEAGISGAGIVERATPRTLWIGLAYRPR